MRGTVDPGAVAAAQPMGVAAATAALLRELGTGPMFVHSDPFRTARLVDRSRSRASFLTSHVAMLRDMGEGRDLWLPSFNYDFPRTRVFDVLADEAQLGPLPEHFRVTASAWRSNVPIFSMAGIGTDPEIEWGDNTDPFGDSSLFAKLVGMDGVILYYGDTFSYNTILHYAERKAGGPPYRYDKVFPGRVVRRDGTGARGSLCYHVRPLGTGLDYDWPRLLDAALGAGVCRRVDGHPELLAASARHLCQLWVGALRDDPLALLDSRSRAWVEPALDDLGRRFLIGDFESPEPLS